MGAIEVVLGDITTEDEIVAVGAAGSDEELANGYVNALLLAEEREAESIAFAVTTERAAAIAAMAVRSLPIIDRIRLVAFDQATYDALTAKMAEPVVEWCPTCGAKAIPILFGRPVEEAGEAAEAGLIHLAGCFVRDDGTDPQWQCTAESEHRWTNGERDERRRQVAIWEARAVTLGEDRGWSVP